jgi:hypothetical protein
MNSAFIAILQQLAAEQGKKALLNPARCKAFLADYTHGDYKKESRLLLQALEAGVPKAIESTKELEICKLQQARVLHEEHFLTAEAAADVVETLALVLRGEHGKGSSQNAVCSNCVKELQKEWKACPYCGTTVAGRIAPGRTYSIGDAGPAGGIVFFDLGFIKDGWRYLEAAPAKDEKRAEWGAYGEGLAVTETGVGFGKRNTQIIVERLSGLGETRQAAQICADLEIKGYKDWFLPSKDELDQMYMNLKQKGLGGFEGKMYWSSSQYDNFNAWGQNFNNGSKGQHSKRFEYSVRTIRAF